MKPFEYRQVDFGGGLNTLQSSFLIGDNEASYLRNVDMDGADRGSLKKRAGWTKLNSSELGSSTGIKSIVRAWYSDATSIIIVTSDTRVLKWTGSAWTAIGTGYTAASKHNFTMFNSLCIGGNAAEATYTVNSSGTLAALGGSPPNTKYFATWQNRVWATGNTTFPNRLYFSALDNEADWTTAGDSGTVDIDKDAGDYITGLLPQGNRLLIFKNNSVHALYWDTPQNYRVDFAARSVGCIAGRTAVDIDGVAVFLHGGGAWRRGVYALTVSDQLTLLSEKITPTLEESSSILLQNACAGRYRNSYWLALDNPNESGTGNNNVILTCNLLSGAWSYYTGIPCASLYADTRLGSQRILGGHATSGFVIQPDNGTDDAGSNINFAWRSKHYAFGKPEVRKGLRELHLMGKTQTCSMTCNVYIDGTAGSWNEVIQFGGASASVNVQTRGIPDGSGNANIWALDIAANNTGSVTIYALAVYGHLEEIGEEGT